MKENDSLKVRTWIEVDRKALKVNYQVFRKLIKPDCKLMAVAKSNAYGHGLWDFAKTMADIGVDWIGVDSITEALTLREKGIHLPILVLGFTLPELMREAVAKNISLTISNFEVLNEISKLSFSGSKLKIHIKVDTGMHRQGFYPNQLIEVIKIIQKSNNVELEGLFTHFASAKDPNSLQDTQKQVENFEQAIKIFETAKFNPIIHASATGGAIIMPKAHYDMVRIGIGLYGHWPSPEINKHYSDKFSLKPALTWKSIVSEIKQVPAGEGIGYDLTENFKSDSTIAVIPIGYWHGFRRNLSGIAHVIICGQKAKVIGRVSMDMIVVDVSKIKDVKIKDHVTIIGKDCNSEITAEDMATLSGTTTYETITCLNPLIKRVYK
jgi:alanine racemase